MIVAQDQGRLAVVHLRPRPRRIGHPMRHLRNFHGSDGHATRRGGGHRRCPRHRGLVHDRTCFACVDAELGGRRDIHGQVGAHAPDLDGLVEVGAQPRRRVLRRGHALQARALQLIPAIRAILEGVAQPRVGDALSVASQARVPQTRVDAGELLLRCVPLFASIRGVLVLEQREVLVLAIGAIHDAVAQAEQSRTRNEDPRLALELHAAALLDVCLENVRLGQADDGIQCRPCYASVEGLVRHAVVQILLLGAVRNEVAPRAPRVPDFTGDLLKRQKRLLRKLLVAWRAEHRQGELDLLEHGHVRDRESLGDRQARRCLRWWYCHGTRDRADGRAPVGVQGVVARLALVRQDAIRQIAVVLPSLNVHVGPGLLQKPADEVLRLPLGEVSGVRADRNAERPRQLELCGNERLVGLQDATERCLVALPSQLLRPADAPGLAILVRLACERALLDVSALVRQQPEERAIQEAGAAAATNLAPRQARPLLRLQAPHAAARVTLLARGDVCEHGVGLGAALVAGLRGPGILASGE
mmetsp:Transcript_13410/g.38650  ORF Transcript_13410/g.38650 Transcript_13410/m.38650 type:complete len:530 (-) Transcript_13410:408-1997(-)